MKNPETQSWNFWKAIPARDSEKIHTFNDRTKIFASTAVFLKFEIYIFFYSAAAAQRENCWYSNWVTPSASASFYDIFNHIRLGDINPRVAYVGESD